MKHDPNVETLPVVGTIVVGYVAAPKGCDAVRVPAIGGHHMNLEGMKAIQRSDVGVMYLKRANVTVAEKSYSILINLNSPFADVVRTANQMMGEKLEGMIRNDLMAMKKRISVELGNNMIFGKYDDILSPIDTIIERLKLYKSSGNLVDGADIMIKLLYSRLVATQAAMEEIKGTDAGDKLKPAITDNHVVISECERLYHGMVAAVAKIIK